MKGHGISEGLAIGTALQGFIDLMEAQADPYLKGRAADYRDLSHQLLWALAGREGHQGPEPGQDWIAVAEDFAPSDISLAESGAVLGFLSQGGAPATHFSILTRIAGLPAVIRVPEALKQIAQGDLLVLDGTAGTVVINPDPETLSAAEAGRQAARLAASPRRTPPASSGRPGSRSCTSPPGKPAPWAPGRRTGATPPTLRSSVRCGFS